MTRVLIAVMGSSHYRWSHSLFTFSRFRNRTALIDSLRRRLLLLNAGLWITTQKSVVVSLSNTTTANNGLITAHLSTLYNATATVSRVTGVSSVHAVQAMLTGVALDLSEWSALCDHLFCRDWCPVVTAGVCALQCAGTCGANKARRAQALATATATPPTARAVPRTAPVLSTRVSPTS